MDYYLRQGDLKRVRADATGHMSAWEGVGDGRPHSFLFMTHRQQAPVANNVTDMYQTPGQRWKNLAATVAV
jgi:hypothetical protein